MITLAQLEEMFDGATNYSWDIRARCVWDYFFTDKDRNRLLAAVEPLERAGFEIVGFLEPTADDDDQGALYLQVRRVERHSPESLHELNHWLYSFAESQKIASYDGMDVSPIGGAA